MVQEEETKEVEEEVLKQLQQSTTDYLISHDKKELKALLTEFREETGEEYENHVLKLEELINVFLTF